MERCFVSTFTNIVAIRPIVSPLLRIAKHCVYGRFVRTMKLTLEGQKNLKQHLVHQGYKRAEIQQQIDRATNQEVQ